MFLETTKKILSRSEKQKSGCIGWTGARIKGYGQVYVSEKNKRDYTHRVVYQTLVGEIPETLTIDHLCKIPHV